MMLSLLTIIALAHPGYDKDIDAATAALEKQPHNAALLVARAELFRRADRCADAISDLEHAEGVAPALPLVWKVRGLTRSQMGQTNRAERALTRYLEDAGPDATVLWARAKIYRTRDNTGAAIADYDSALTLATDVDLYLERGAILSETGQLNRAAKGLREGLRETNSAVLRWELCQVELARGLPRAVLEEAPDRGVRWLLLRAQAHDALRQRGAARDARHRALTAARLRVENRPSPRHRKQLAAALIALDQFDEAVEILIPLLDNGSPDTEAHRLHKVATQTPAATQTPPGGTSR
jgi:tetratricopeptide (TPR) repeat protein